MVSFGGRDEASVLRRRAYDNGFKAKTQGKKLDENPHREGSEEHHAWNLGWRYGE